MWAERCVGSIPGHSAFHQDHVVAPDLVFEAYLVLCTVGDPLLTPALDAGEVGLGEIEGHPGRLSVDIGSSGAGTSSGFRSWPDPSRAPKPAD